MPRPRKHRCCRRYHADRVYKPQGIPMREVQRVEVSLDEFEALRLCDVEGLTQDEAGERMGVSRGTIQRLVTAGRRRLMGAIVENQAILINLQSDEATHACMHSHQRRSGTGRRGA